MNGVLLVNLGTPDAPTPAAIRPWLREFLSDPRVVDLPRWLWLPVLHAVILPLRPRKLAPLYQRIWTPEGSPLLAITRQQRLAVAAALGDRALVVEAMRYGTPSIGAALAGLQRAGVSKLVVLPLYPQYSTSTTASVRDAVAGWTGALAFIDDYAVDAGYIAALAASVREHWARHGRGDRLLLSFHGIPVRYVERGDPYARQCEATAQALAAALELAPADWLLSYQSRVGKAAWLEPYTEDALRQLPAQGVRRLDVVCPGFSADCLETLDEIAIRGAETFVAAGGEALRYVPALNARPDHVAALAHLVGAHLP